MMKLFKLFALLIFILLTSTGFSQTAAGNEVQMADKFYAEGKIYVVITVIAIVFIGIAAYLFIIERKIKKLEQALKEKN